MIGDNRAGEVGQVAGNPVARGKVADRPGTERPVAERLVADRPVAGRLVGYHHVLHTIIELCVWCTEKMIERQWKASMDE